MNLTILTNIIHNRSFCYFPFGFEGRMWDMFVSVPDHCLSFYFNLASTDCRVYNQTRGEIRLLTYYKIYVNVYF